MIIPPSASPSWVKSELVKKQDKLTQGDGIAISNNVVSVDLAEATQTASGLMSAEDKKNLDTLKAGTISEYVKDAESTGVLLNLTKADGSVVSVRVTNVGQNAIDTDAAYPILLSGMKATNTATGTVAATNMTKDVTVNPMTGEVTAPIFKGSLEGTASKAVADADGNAIASTYAKASEYLPLTGGTLTGNLSIGGTTSFGGNVTMDGSGTPLIIGSNGKIGLRAKGAGLANAGQINISDSWYGAGNNRWGAQMSAYDSVSNKYNQFRVSHDGLQYLIYDNATGKETAQQVALTDDLANLMTTDTAQNITGAKAFVGTVGNTQSEPGVYLGLDTNANAPNANLAIVSSNTAAYIDFARPNEDYGFRIIKWNGLYDDAVQLCYNNASLTIPRSTGTIALTHQIPDVSGFATKAEIPDVSGFATKAEVSLLPTFEPKVVQSLPTSNISNKVLYLVPADNGENDRYDQYIYINNAWERIGSGGLTIDTALSDSSTNPVQNKVIKAALDGKLSTTGTAARATADADGNAIASTYVKTATLDSYALKTDLPTTSYIGTASQSITYAKVHGFGEWGTGTWYTKGFSLLLSARAGETVWVSVSADDSNTNAKAFRIMNSYSKIRKVYYSVSESAIYCELAAWANNLCATVIVNNAGDFSPIVNSASGLPSDAVNIPIVSMGPTGSALELGSTDKALSLIGKDARPTYTDANGAHDLALVSDLPTGGSNVSIVNGVISATDQKVGQTAVGSDDEFPILLKTSPNASAETGGVGFASGVTINPMTGHVSAVAFDGPATKALADADGNAIASTYAKKTELGSYAKASELSKYLLLNGGTMTGPIILIGSNPHLGLTDATGTAYFQTYDDGTGVFRAGFGYGWSNSFKVDTSGNMAVPGSVTASSFKGTADKATADASGNTITSTYATKSEIPDISGLATKTYVDEAVGSIDVGSLSGFLPLTGGTLTGDLTISYEVLGKKVGSVSLGDTAYITTLGNGLILSAPSSTTSTGQAVALDPNSGLIPMIFNDGSSDPSLGSSEAQWKEIHGKVIYQNGKQVATLEDLAGVSGGASDDYLPLTGGTLSGNLEWSNSSTWCIPYLLAFRNAAGNSVTYPYTGFYQWGPEWQVNARDASNTYAHNLLSINNETRVATFGARPTVNGAGLAMQSEVPRITISPDEPSGGQDGDIWLQYEE